MTLIEKNENAECLTHISLIFESVTTVRSTAVKVRGALTLEGAIGRDAVFGCSESLKAFLNDGRVLAMVIGMHLHIRRGYVNLVTILMNAVIMCLFAIVRTIAMRGSVRAIVGRRVPQEAVLQGLVPLLVPLEVPDHLLFLDKHSTAAI